MFLDLRLSPSRPEALPDDCEASQHSDAYDYQYHQRSCAYSARLLYDRRRLTL